MYFDLKKGYRRNSSVDCCPLQGQKDMGPLRHSATDRTDYDDGRHRNTYRNAHICVPSSHESSPTVFIHTHVPVFKMPSMHELTQVGLLHAHSFICATHIYHVPIPGDGTLGKTDKIPVL